VENPVYRTSLPNDPMILIALNRDVFFGVRLRNLAKELGYDLKLVPGAAAVAEALTTHHATTALVIVDLNVIDMGIDWPVLQNALTAWPEIPSLGFGSHTDVEVRRDAKRAGLTRIVSNGDFHRDAAALIQRYARVDDDE
jgi:hypothetical protein